jgi:hypothetical protein
MTKEEIEIIELTKEIWNKFLALPVEHSADIRELEFHTHAIQNIVLSRVGLREYKKETA